MIKPCGCIVLLLVVLAEVASAQRLNELPPDSLIADSSSGRGCTLPHTADSPIVLLAVAAAAAPPLLFGAFKCPPGGRLPFRFLPHGIAASLSGGPVASQNQDLGWGHVVDVEGRVHHVYGEFQLEHYYLFPQNLRYESARIGYLAQTPLAVGGFTVGYRGVHGPAIKGRQQGLEFGLPFIIGNTKRTWRLEPYYVVTTHGTTWNYRLEYDHSVGKGSYAVGWRAEAISLPVRSTSGLDWFTISAVFGFR